MAIKPLETRLDDLAATLGPEPELPVDAQPQTAPEAPLPENTALGEEPVQVAGLVSGMKAILSPAKKLKDVPPDVQMPPDIKVPPPPPTAPTQDRTNTWAILRPARPGSGWETIR